VEESLTSGRIRCVSATEAHDLISREVEAFRSRYPQAQFTLDSGTSRNAVGALFAAEADMAIITRELTDDERRAATAGGLELEGYRFARSALVVVVHPSNPVENLALDDLRRVYGGTVTRWSELGGGDGLVRPLTQAPASDAAEFFVEEVLATEGEQPRAEVVADDSAVVAAVARDPRAVGYVSLGTATEGVRAMRLASWTGLPYWKPDLEAVYRGDYPLTRYYNMYVRAGGPPLANGFITFVTSFDGQKIVNEAGLVPTSIPVRFVRRSPMLSAHPRGDSIPTP
jgi:phosphate transport system substrate-binding protein